MSICHAHNTLHKPLTLQLTARQKVEEAEAKPVCLDADIASVLEKLQDVKILKKSSK